MKSQFTAGSAGGGSARVLPQPRHRYWVILALIGCGLIACTQWADFPVRSIPTFVACMVGLAAVERLLPHPEHLKLGERHAIRGAKSEQSVHALLDRLPPNHLVLRDLPSRHGNINHLVFRQDGAVFVLETLSHNGQVTKVEGQLRRDGKPFENDFIRQTYTHAFWVRDFLHERFGVFQWVHSALVFPNASVSVPHGACGVEVIGAKTLEKWMAKARGNPELAQRLWPRRDQLQAALLACTGDDTNPSAASET